MAEEKARAAEEKRKPHIDTLGRLVLNEKPYTLEEYLRLDVWGKLGLEDGEKSKARRAFKQIALVTHPDKNQGKEGFFHEGFFKAVEQAVRSLDDVTTESKSGAEGSAKPYIDESGSLVLNGRAYTPEQYQELDVWEMLGLRKGEKDKAKRAFMQLVLVIHPDKNPSISEEFFKAAQQAHSAIQEDKADEVQAERSRAKKEPPPYLRETIPEELKLTPQEISQPVPPRPVSGFTGWDLAEAVRTRNTQWIRACLADNVNPFLRAVFLPEISHPNHFYTAVPFAEAVGSGYVELVKVFVEHYEKQGKNAEWVLNQLSDPIEAKESAPAPSSSSTALGYSPAQEPPLQEGRQIWTSGYLVTAVRQNNSALVNACLYNPQRPRVNPFERAVIPSTLSSPSPQTSVPVIDALQRGHTDCMKVFKTYLEGESGLTTPWLYHYSSNDAGSSLSIAMAKPNYWMITYLVENGGHCSAALNRLVEKNASTPELRAIMRYLSVTSHLHGKKEAKKKSHDEKSVASVSDTTAVVGYSPLSLAFVRGDRGESVASAWDTTDVLGYSPLGLALIRNDLDWLRYLIANGASLEVGVPKTTQDPLLVDTTRYTAFQFMSSPQQVCEGWQGHRVGLMDLAKGATDGNVCWHYLERVRKSSNKLDKKEERALALRSDAVGPPSLDMIDVQSPMSLERACEIRDAFVSLDLAPIVTGLTLLRDPGLPELLRRGPEIVYNLNHPEMLNEADLEKQVRDHLIACEQRKALGKRGDIKQWIKKVRGVLDPVSATLLITGGTPAAPALKGAASPPPAILPSSSSLAIAYPTSSPSSSSGKSSSLKAKLKSLATKVAFKTKQGASKEIKSLPVLSKEDFVTLAQKGEQGGYSAARQAVLILGSNTINQYCTIHNQSQEVLEETQPFFDAFKQEDDDKLIALLRGCTVSVSPDLARNIIDLCGFYEAYQLSQKEAAPAERKGGRIPLALSSTSSSVPSAAVQVSPQPYLSSLPATPPSLPTTPPTAPHGSSAAFSLRQPGGANVPANEPHSSEDSSQGSLNGGTPPAGSKPPSSSG